MCNIFVLDKTEDEHTTEVYNRWYDSSILWSWEQWLKEDNLAKNSLPVAPEEDPYVRWLRIGDYIYRENGPWNSRHDSIDERVVEEPW